MGYRGWQRLLLVELPVAVPVIAAGLRVAVVSNVSIVTMAALLGIPQLGSLFTQGFQLRLFAPLVIGVVLCVVLAVVFDGLILWRNRLLTPWRQRRSPHEHRRLVHRSRQLDGLGRHPRPDRLPPAVLAVALLIALAIAVPLGIVIGYTGRGEAVVAGFANALRALPSLGLLVLLFLIISPVCRGQARLRAADHHRAGAAGGSADPHRDLRGHPERRPGRRRRRPRNGFHEAPDPAAGPVPVRATADDVRSQERRLCRSSRPPPSPHISGCRASAGSSSTAERRRTSPKWPAAQSLSPCSPSSSSSPSPGSAASSCRPVCGARLRKPAHRSPPPSSRRAAT